MSDYRIVEENPSVRDFIQIRCAAGLSEKTERATALALPNTLFCVCVKYGDEVVGMGRVVGDGGVSFEVRDIAVLPAHQKKGLGAKIMEAIMRYLREHAPPTAFVTLFADPGVPPFYEKYGFQVSEPLMTGMHLRVK